MADIEFQIPTVLTLVTKDDGAGNTKRFFQTTASSTVEDAHADEFTPVAIDKMASQAKGSRMSIFLNHEYRIPEDLFGTTTDAVAVKRANADGTEFVTDLDLEGFINEANPRARETADALEGGAKLGVSIGARIKDYRPRDEKDPMGGWIIDDVELKEASIVGMPANPRTWVHYASKAITAFDRQKVKEAADMNMTATDVATRPADTGVLEDGGELEALLEANDPEKTKVLTTQQLPGATPDGEQDQPEFDGDPAIDEDVPEAAEASASEEPAQETGSPAEEDTSETPAEALSQAVATASEGTSLEAMRTVLKAVNETLLQRDEQIDQLTQERDAALETLAEATAIIEQIATTPLGRKAVPQEQVKDYRSRVNGIYDPEFMKFLKGNSTQ